QRARWRASSAAIGTDETRWLAEIHLCFGACGTTLEIDDLDGEYAPDLLVTAGEVVELDDRGAYSSSATGVLESAAEHRLAVASRLAELYGRRAMTALVLFLLAAEPVQPWAAREVLAHFEHEPDVRAVQAMAAEYANA